MSLIRSLVDLPWNREPNVFVAAVAEGITGHFLGFARKKGKAEGRRKIQLGEEENDQQENVWVVMKEGEV